MTAQKVGRNDPCPCGSGEKYKKCCLRKDSQPDLSQQEWNDLSYNLTEKLLAYLSRPKFDTEYNRVLDKFYPEEPMDDPFAVDEYDMMAIDDYMINQHRFDSLGGTLIAHFLEEMRTDLSPEERSLLKNRLASRCSIFEVQEVYPGKGLLLKDLFQDDFREVQDVVGSQNLFQWDVLAANVYKIGEEYQIAGNAIIIPGHLIDWVQSSLLEEYRRYQEDGGQLDFQAFLRDRMYLVYRWMIEQRNTPPVLVNKEGEEIVWCTARYSLIDKTKVLTHLREHPMFGELNEETGKQEFNWWLRDEVAEELGFFNEDDAFSSIFGTLRISGEEMIVEVNSRSRLEVARSYLEDVLEGVLELADETLQPLEELEQKHDALHADSPMSVMTPEMEEDAREVLRQYQLDYYYNNWVYHSLPVLNGLTPIEAYTRELENLDDLLKNLENGFIRAGEPDASPDIEHLKSHIEELSEQNQSSVPEEFYMGMEKQIGESLAELAVDVFDISREETLAKNRELAFDEAIIYRSEDGLQFGYVDSVQEGNLMVVFLDPIPKSISREDILTVLKDEETEVINRHFEDLINQTSLSIQFAQEFDLRESDPVLSTFSALTLVIYRMEDLVYDMIKEMSTRSIDFRINFEPTPGHYVMKTQTLVLSVPEICAGLLGIDETLLKVEDSISSDVKTLPGRAAFHCIYYASLVLYSHQHNRRLRNPAHPGFTGLFEHIYRQKYTDVLDDISGMLDLLEDITESNIQELYKHIREKAEV